MKMYVSRSRGRYKFQWLSSETRLGMMNSDPIVPALKCTCIRAKQADNHSLRGTTIIVTTYNWTISKTTANNINSLGHN